MTSYSFSGSEISGSVSIKTWKDIHFLRDEANVNYCDELLGLIETVDYHVRQRLFNFPLKAQFSSPDAIISVNSETIGLEITRLQWTALAQALNTSNGRVIPVTQALCCDRSLRYIQEANRIEAPGWIWKETIDNTFDLFQARVNKKTDKLLAYKAAAAVNWLFLIDNHDILCAWDEIINLKRYKKRLSDISCRSGFDKILLYRWPDPVRKERVNILFSTTD